MQGVLEAMMWKLALSVAIRLGLKDWAKRKAADLIAKAKDKLKKKVEGLEKVQTLVTSSGGTTVVRGKDGLDYVVRFERRAP